MLILYYIKQAPVIRVLGIVYLVYPVYLDTGYLCAMPQVNPCMVPPPHIDIVVFPLLWQNATRGPKGHLCLDLKGQEGLVGAICSKILGMYLSYPCNPACDVTPTPV